MGLGLLGGPASQDEPDAVSAPEAGSAHLPRPREPADTDPDTAGAGTATVDSVERRTAERLRQLERRVRRLERLVSGNTDRAAARPSFELDDPEIVALAASAEHARELARMLVTPTVRAACERAIEAEREWLGCYAQARDDALAASRVLATTGPGQRRHREAQERYERARAELDALLPDRQRVSNAARHARQQLARDWEVRERHGHEISDGERAWAALIARLRARIATAVERDEPLPIWLIDTLGTPPSGHATAWHELATQVLAYRVTYRVTDPKHALGAEPSSTDSARRRRWYRALAGELAGS